MEIEIVSTHVIIPSSPTPTHLRDHKLSFLDERIPPSYIPLILYYNGHKNITQSEMCDRLKRSLSDALVRFYPLAGRMNGQISVDCNDQGILYLEAKADGKISDIIKSMDSDDHYDFLENLIPFKSNGIKRIEIPSHTKFFHGKTHPSRGFNSVFVEPLSNRKRGRQFFRCVSSRKLERKIPGVTRNSFGNIYQMARAENVAGEKNWIILAEKIRDAFGKMDGEYFQELLGEKGFEVAKENFMGISKYLALGNVEVLRFSSFCRLGFYGADFGWGKPVWVSSGSYGGKDRIFLFDSVEWDGGIEAWIVLADQEMERLQQDLEFQHFTSSFAS
ncbi:hypothetical protein DH2020_038652 [Rehmannia glutinosa]|uniref:Uncharacterized protein n=1 Tax=Rehmannia glutinosa TaxID=99300 RepID=A0ABR0UY14_REHGL